MKITERKGRIMSVVKFYRFCFYFVLGFFSFYLISYDHNKLGLQFQLSVGCFPCLPRALRQGCLSVQQGKCRRASLCLVLPSGELSVTTCFLWCSWTLSMWIAWEGECGVHLLPPHRQLLVLPARVESVAISSWDFASLGLWMGEVNVCVYICIIKC